MIDATNTTITSTGLVDIKVESRPNLKISCIKKTNKNHPPALFLTLRYLIRVQGAVKEYDKSNKTAIKNPIRYVWDVTCGKKCATQYITKKHILVKKVNHKLFIYALKKFEGLYTNLLTAGKSLMMGDFSSIMYFLKVWILWVYITLINRKTHEGSI